MHKFRIRGPRAKKMLLRWREQMLPVQGPNQRGWWTLEMPEAEFGDTYAFLLDDDATAYRNPRSLCQADGAHGPSTLYDHTSFERHDQLWRGSPKTGVISYELYIGTFSQ